MSFGEYFTAIRVESGFKTQKDLARKSGVSQTTISRIESNLQKPDPETLKKLSELMSISYEELMRMAGYLNEGAEDNDNWRQRAINAEAQLLELEAKLKAIQDIVGGAK